MNREMDYEGPWHQGVLREQYTFTVNEEVYDWIDINENVSHQCPGGYDGSIMPCIEDRPLWWRVLTWLKEILLKMARSYHGRPLLLCFAPLLVGIAIGYVIGYKASSKSRKHASKQKQRFTNSVSWITAHTLGMFSNMLYTLGDTSSLSTQSTLKKDQPAKSTSSEVHPTIVSERREHSVRANLKSDAGTHSESGVDPCKVPQHVAVIMDGNRRYGKEKYGNVSKGHWDGSSKLVEFAKWCIAEHVSVLTVYAFSTENWNRDPSEVASLMAIFAKYCDELRVEALERNIKILVLSTDSTRIPQHVKKGIDRMVNETQHCTGLTMNICLSYGSRGEIVEATKSIARDVERRAVQVDSIDEELFERHLLTSHSGDPDVLIRTSGEVRISNFLLWQLAYCEMFFLDKPWPAVEKEDLLRVIRTYAKGRIRRFGK